MTDRAEDIHVERRQQAVSIAVLQEQVTTLGREMGELKKVNQQQSEKLDVMLQQMAEARGGLRTTLWFGGSMATFGGALAWGIEQFVHILGKHP